MAGNKPNLVIFGAGMTGRGHIAQLAFESGWDLTFIDKDLALVDLLKQHGKYVVHLISDNPRDVNISGFKVFHSEDRSAIESIASADMIITSVLPNNLADVAPLLAEGLLARLKKNDKPINVIAAENMNDGSSMLWKFTSEYLSTDEQEQYGKAFGFPNSMVARVVPKTTDPLYIVAEDYNEWTADINHRVGESLNINGLEWVSNQEARLKRKLYIHNTGHAVCAYLGVIKGYKYIHESAQDEWVLSWVKQAIAESGRAVGREFGFDDSIIETYAQSLTDRLPKDALPDTIDRVVREPIRKLGLTDRFIGPITLCEKYGLPKDGLCLGIAAVLASNIKDEEGKRLTELIKEKGIAQTLTQVANYTPDSDSGRRIEMFYNSLISHAFSSIKQPIYDVLGIGIVAVDDLVIVDSYPPADSKMRGLGEVRQGGGLTGTALVAGARLGAKCAYAGILGKDELSNWTVSELEREGVDCSLTLRSGDVKPYHAIIIVDTTHHTRTIIFTDVGVMIRPMETIDEDYVSKAKVILIDQLGIDVMLHTTLLAKKLGIPTVADIEREDHPQTRELISHIDHLILSTSFAGKITDTDDPVEQVERLHNGRACTAVTVGIKGCYYTTKDDDDKIYHQPAFKVQTVDTTGCGDVFHGAYAVGIAREWDIHECIKFASAVSALKATKAGGRAGIPDMATVEEFLDSDPATYD
jgi:mannitol-1-phosphate 5-dehydrogenase